MPHVRTYSVAVCPPITVGSGGTGVSGFDGLLAISHVQVTPPPPLPLP